MYLAPARVWSQDDSPSGSTRGRTLVRSNPRLGRQSETNRLVRPYADSWLRDRGQVMSTYCTRCGAQIDPGARYCTSCGHGISEDSADKSETVGQGVPSSTEVPAAPNRAAGRTYAVVAIAIAVAAIGGWWFAQHDDADSRPSFPAAAATASTAPAAESPSSDGTVPSADTVTRNTYKGLMIGENGDFRFVMRLRWDAAGRVIGRVDQFHDRDAEEAAGQLGGVDHVSGTLRGESLSLSTDHWQVVDTGDTWKSRRFDYILKFNDRSYSRFRGKFECVSGGCQTGPQDMSGVRVSQ